MRNFYFKNASKKLLNTGFSSFNI